MKDPFENENLKIDDMFIIMNKNKEKHLKSQESQADFDKSAFDDTSRMVNESKGKIFVLMGNLGFNSNASLLLNDQSSGGFHSMDLSKIPEGLRNPNMGGNDFLYMRLKRIRPDDSDFDQNYENMTTEDKLRMLEEENLREAERKHKRIKVHEFIK